MFASLDCMHYEWKNCLVAWQGDYGDREGKKSIILEAIADSNLHIWHVFFGLPGSNNDVNVLDCSPLVHNMLSSEVYYRVERSLLWKITGSLAAAGNDLRVGKQLLFSKPKIVVKQTVFNRAHTKNPRPTSSIQR